MLRPTTAVALLLIGLTSACLTDGQLGADSSLPNGDADTGNDPAADRGTDPDGGTASDAPLDDSGLEDLGDTDPEDILSVDAADTTAADDAPGDLAADANPDSGGPGRAPPTYEQLDDLVDFFRGTVPTWVSFMAVTGPDWEPAYHWAEYGDTGDRLAFWPASTIKIYTVTSALELLAAEGYTLDATADFYHRASSDAAWTFDTTRTFRKIIFDTFDFSSNSDYTLLLRFAGVDWLNTEFFTAENGFEQTALMRGYVTSRPALYRLSEEQRIVVKEGDDTWERVHIWSGTSYADAAGCTIYNATGTGNCSTPNDMVEHMRRLMFHETLPVGERFDVDLPALNWVRFGDDEPVLNDWESRWADGIFRVMPAADYYHKAGRVSDYALDLHYVDDAASGTRYAAAIVTESTSTATYDKLSEEIARMALTPYTYVHLDFLADYVNPIGADVWVYTTEPGDLELIVKDYDLDPDLGEGWSVLAGTTTPVEAGSSWWALESDCLEADDRVHIRGRFTPDADDLPIAYSDLHFVIVDGDVACP